jgi:hypothetical protein
MKHGWKALGLLVALAVVPACTKPAPPVDPLAGTWVKTASLGKPEMTMLVEKADKGALKLTYLVGDGKMKIAVVTAMDGSDAPMQINGHPTDETMAITRVDKLNTSTVLKKKGVQFGTSKGTLSDDFKTLTVVADYAANSAVNPNSKVTESWTRK